MYNRFKNIDIFILCGGFGKRLGKVSRNIPKPMIKIGNRPFLDIIINYLSGFGFRRFILGIGYNAWVIKNYYRNNQTPDLDILFSEEKIPLDTGGALKNAKKLIKSNPFFVLNGDSFSKFNPRDFLNFHQQKKALISILLKRISNGKEYGEIKIGKYLRIVHFNEKNNKAKKCLINAGIYIFDKRVFKLMPSVVKFSLEYDFFPQILKEGVFGYVNSGFFIDIGTPKGYFRARKYFFKNSPRYGLNG